MITYQVEKWEDYFRDSQQLWEEHYEEIAVQKDKMAMKPDVHLFQTMEAGGSLHILTVREKGKMVGYHITFIRPHAHYADVLCGFVDAYFISPSCRKGMVGVKLFKEAEKTMKARGVKKIFTGTKNSKNMSKIFEYLGWKPTEQLFSKWIGD